MVLFLSNIKGISVCLISKTSDFPSFCRVVYDFYGKILGYFSWSRYFRLNLYEIAWEFLFTYFVIKINTSVCPCLVRVFMNSMGKHFNFALEVKIVVKFSVRLILWGFVFRLSVYFWLNINGSTAKYYIFSNVKFGIFKPP